MTLIALMGAIEVGLVYALVALGVLISFRILDFPDLTSDGSFPLGGAVAATMIVAGFNPWLATLAAMGAGAVAGLLTGYLNVRLNILQLLASILVMIALYSVNLRIMGGPNVALLDEPSVFTSLNEMFPEQPDMVLTGLLVALVIAAMMLLNYFFGTRTGLAMRATGANPRMARSQAIATGSMVLLGMAISNSLIALGGALYVQTQGGADISIGVGTIVIGLAAVIIGETIIPGRKIWVATLSAVVGALLYRLFIAVALEADFIGLQAQDMNLVTAILVGLALVLPTLKRKFAAKRAQTARRSAHTPSPDSLGDDNKQNRGQKS